jgi:hypothetical protein
VKKAGSASGRDAMPRLFVKFDKEGQILAVSRVETLPEGQKNPFYDETDPEIEIIELKDTAANAVFKDLGLADIHLGYTVDPKKKALKKKPA